MKYFLKNICFWMDEMIFAMCMQLEPTAILAWKNMYMYFKAKMGFKLTTLMIQVHCSTRWAMRSWYIGSRSSVSFNVQHRDLKIVARHQLSAKLASWSKGDYWQDGAMRRDDDHCHFLLSPGEKRIFTSSPHHFAFTILHMQLLYGQSSLISLKSNLIYN